VTRQVQFKLNSAELTDADKTALDEVAENLTRLKFVSGTVGGHTDSSGTEAYNQKLSERRAETVATYLQGKGIAVGRLAGRVRSGRERADCRQQDCGRPRPEPPGGAEAHGLRRGRWPSGFRRGPFAGAGNLKRLDPEAA